MNNSTDAKMLTEIPENLLIKKSPEFLQEIAGESNGPEFLTEKKDKVNLEKYYGKEPTHFTD